MRTSTTTRLVLLIVIAAAVFGTRQLFRSGPPADTTTARPAPAASSARATGGDDLLAELLRDRRSGVMVTGWGRVQKVLPDDTEGARHQRFILRLASEQTVLVAHNIDLAERVPVGEGDEVRFRGQFEWNDRGGVIHWTHHDPDGRREGGWLEARGRRYE